MFHLPDSFPNPAARQAHYLNIHKQDTKRARFGQDPPRRYHTPPTSPFLSRSVEDLNNPSLYDSGYDSAYSNASRPGHPPSSRGNSDIDDHVDRYLHDQRVAILVVEDTPPIDSPPTTLATQARLREASQHHRRIATYHQLTQTSSPVDLILRHVVRGSPRPFSPRALRRYRPTTTHTNAPSDPAPSDGDDQSTTSSPMPSLIDASSSDEDDYFNRDPAISDDTRNAINRSYARMQSRSPSAPPGQPPFDIRVATNDSDSTRTPIYNKVVFK